MNDVVLDCTEFKSKHPAGKAIIEGFGGYDCTWQVSSFAVISLEAHAVGVVVLPFAADHAKVRQGLASCANGGPAE